MLLNYVRTLRNLNRNVLLYLAATALLGFAVDGGVYSVLFNLFLLRVGFGPEFIGQAAAAGLLAFSIAALPAGSIGERFGYRTVMAVGLATMGLCGFILPLTDFLPPNWIAPAIITLFVTLYIGMGLYYVNAVPYVMSLSSDDERSRAFSMQTAFIAMAAFTGSLAGGLLPGLFAVWFGVDLQHPGPYRLPLMLASFLMLPSIFILFRIQRPAIEHSQENASLSVDVATTGVKRSAWGIYSPVIITIFVVSFIRLFQVSGVATAYTFFNVYMDTELSVSTANIGLIIAGARLVGVFAALSTPILVGRWGAAATVLVASIIGVISILPLALIPYWLAAAIGFIGVTSISSMRFPAYMIFTMPMVPSAWRGTMAGMGEFAGGLSFAGLAFIGGSMAENQGFSALFLLGGALTLTGTLLFYFWFVLPRAKQTETPVTNVSSESAL